MTPAVKATRHFLSLLVDSQTPLNQKHTLIFTSSSSQAGVLAEIIFNLGAGLIHLPKSAKPVIKRNSSLIKAISEAKTSTRAALIRNKYKRVCSIIVSALKLIRDLLAECKSRC